MKSHLEVAVGIADAINHAHASKKPLDVEAHAIALTRELDVPRLTRQIVAEVLRAEGRAAGIALVRAF